MIFSAKNFMEFWNCCVLYVEESSEIRIIGKPLQRKSSARGGGALRFGPLEMAVGGGGLGWEPTLNGGPSTK